jgi:hypothetical protein
MFIRNFVKYTRLIEIIYFYRPYGTEKELIIILSQDSRPGLLSFVPLGRLDLLLSFFPGLTSWATVFCPFGTIGFIIIIFEGVSKLGIFLGDIIFCRNSND